MMRDMDLIREVLLEVEDKCHGYRGISFEVPRDDLEGENGRKAYHLGILVEGGFVEGDVTRDSSGICCMAEKLTWKGHEFLDAAREPKRWKQAKSLILDKAGGASIAVWTRVLLSQINENLGLVGG